MENKTKREENIYMYVYKSYNNICMERYLFEHAYIVILSNELNTNFEWEKVRERLARMNRLKI